MKIYTKSVVAISGWYAFAVATFLLLAFFATDGGIGWDFFTAIILAIMTVPMYISILAICRCVDVTEQAKIEKNTLNIRFEKILSVISVCLTVVSVLTLIAFFVSMLTYIRNDFIRNLFFDVIPSLLLTYSCIANVIILLDRPLSTFILWLARKKNPLYTIENKTILTVRIALPLITFFSLLLILFILRFA